MQCNALCFALTHVLSHNKHPWLTAQVRIKLKAYHVPLLQQSVESITDAVAATGATVSGPVPLPTRRRIYTVLR